MENNNIYYKKYLKYKIKYINLLNNYQSNKNINEQILGGSTKIKNNDTPTTNSTNTPNNYKKTHKKKIPETTYLSDINFLYYFKRLLYNFENHINTSEQFKMYFINNITETDLKKKMKKMKKIICLSDIDRVPMKVNKNISYNL